MKVFTVSKSDSSIGISESSFDLFRPDIEIIKPSTKDEWYFGQTDTIRWIKNRQSDENVEIQLLLKNSLIGGKVDTVELITNGNSNQEYLYAIPETLKDTIYTVKIKSTLNSKVIDFQDINITNLPKITINNPDLSAPSIVGQKHLISWESDSLNQNKSNIRIECLLDAITIDTIAVEVTIETPVGSTEIVTSTHNDTILAIWQA